jgi:hypothetical protein
VPLSETAYFLAALSHKVIERRRIPYQDELGSLALESMMVKTEELVGKTEERRLTRK